VEVRPVDVSFSFERAALEVGADAPLAAQGGAARAEGSSSFGVEGPAVRIGLDAVGGLRRRTAERIAAERARAPFSGLGDFVRRSRLDRDELDALAELGALSGLSGAPGERREALWQVAALERDPHSLFAGRAIARPADATRETAPLPGMSEIEATLADYRLAGLTTGVHLMAHLREALDRRGVVSAAQLRETPDGTWVRTAGHAIVRQRPGSAKGFCFVTLEDETGLSNAVLTPDIAVRFRVPLHQASLLEVEGPLQRVDGVIHVRAKELRPLILEGAKLPASHDYR
jgi:error-prone DNA polymerase